ncbi:MAG: hypothetical protein ACTSYG_08790 [Candidatus Heimdallarchaeota archaeon]
MKSIQPTLINFPQFKMLELFDNKVVLSSTKQGVIVHTKRVTCPCCGKICNYNGNSNKGKHSLTQSSGNFLQKGQQFCPDCGKTIQVENTWLDELITSMKQFIVSQVLSLSNGKSEDEIVEHFNSTMSIKIAKSTVHNIISKSHEELAALEFDYEVKENFYGYDEQYLKINGKSAYRLVFFDIKENKILYEKVHYRFSKKILKQILKEVFGDKAPKGFVVDMKVEYPSAFKEIFGRKIKIQFCVFHLNKLILKEYRDALRIGKKVKWSLTNYYNLYTLFNIFYNRSFELKLLKKFLKNFENFKHKLNLEKIKFYVNKYNLKTKNTKTQKRKVIQIIETKMMKAFRKMLRNKRKFRKRKKLTLQPQTKTSAEDNLDRVINEIQLYPSKIQKRIMKIKKNFVYFIASEGEIMTNNKLEGFFGATLKKFRKKMRKSLVSISAILKRKRLQQEGKSFFRKFTLYDLAKIFVIVSFL